MTPATPEHGGDPTPALGNPLPAGNCPRCRTLCYLILLPHAERDQIHSPDPGRPCTICPHCGAPLWLRLVERPTVARPVDAKTTALIPKDRHTRHWKNGLAPTEIIRSDPADDPGPERA